MSRDHSDVEQPEEIRLPQIHPNDRPGPDGAALRAPPRPARRLRSGRAARRCRRRSRRCWRRSLPGRRSAAPKASLADLHRIAELGTAQGLRLLLAQAARLGIVIAPEQYADASDRRLDAKHVALRVFLDHPKVFDAASDMLALTARSSLAEFAGLEEGVEADLGDGARAAFEAGAAKMFEADHCGRYCRVGWYDDADTVNLVLTHGSIVRTASILRGDEERLVSYRATENAVLSYSAATGRIRIGGGTQAPEIGLVGALRRQDARALRVLFRPGRAEPLHAGADRAHRMRVRLPARLRSGHSKGADRRGAGRPVEHGPVLRDHRLASTVVARDDRGGALDQLAETMRSPVFGPDRRLRHIVVRVNIDVSSGRPGQVTAKITPPAQGDTSIVTASRSASSPFSIATG